MKSPAKDIPGLTPLRGIAATLVAVFHFQLYLLRFVNKEESMFIDKGYLMVDLFFIMSGFLIMHVYNERFVQKITFTAFKKFIIARFARIYPLHLITLLLLVAFFYLKIKEPVGIYQPHAIASHVLLLHSFPVNTELFWNIPSWSISAEWWAYILFPFICLFLFKNKTLGIIIISLCILMIYISLMYLIPRQDPVDALQHNLDITYDYGFLRSFAGFMAGMLLYLFYQKEFIKKVFSSDILCIAGIAGTLFMLHKGLPDIFYIPAFAILILLFTSNSQKMTAALNNKVFKFIGDISYSIYMIHFLFILAIQIIIYALGYRFSGIIILPFLNGLFYCLLYLLILIGLSALSYYIIEKPCRKYINLKWVGK